MTLARLVRFVSYVLQRRVWLSETPLYLSYSSIIFSLRISSYKRFLAAHSDLVSIDKRRHCHMLRYRGAGSSHKHLRSLPLKFGLPEFRSSCLALEHIDLLFLGINFPPRPSTAINGGTRNMYYVFAGRTILRV